MNPSDPIRAPGANQPQVGSVEGAIAVGGNIAMQGQYVAGRDLVVEEHVHVPQAQTLDLFQLPADITDFTDRQEQVLSLRQVLERVAETAIVVSAIVGKPGVGKTALAIRTAHQLRQRFPDGQLYADLRGAEPQPLHPADVLADFLRALGVANDAVPTNLDARERMYRARLTPLKVLVVLDNAANEAQVRPLLPGSPSCGVLITSRTPLAVPTTLSMVLQVLAHHHAVELLAKPDSTDDPIVSGDLPCDGRRLGLEMG